MAAVLALIMVPLCASLGMFLGTTGHEGTLRAGFAGATFAVLGLGMLFGLLKLVRGLEE
jgi:hypothetical protein